ncbi:MAG: hypothetical protein V2A79_09805 [Planctomycetota bacterium]
MGLYRAISIPLTGTGRHKRLLLVLVSYGPYWGFDWRQNKLWYYSQCCGVAVGLTILGLTLKLERMHTELGETDWLARYRRRLVRHRSFDLHFPPWPKSDYDEEGT